jgi:hypothetical protein
MKGMTPEVQVDSPARHSAERTWIIAAKPCAGPPRKTFNRLPRSRAPAHHVSAGWWKDLPDFTRIMVGLRSLRSLVRTLQFASIRTVQIARRSVADNLNARRRSLPNIVVGGRPARRMPCAGPPRFGGLLERPVSGLHPHRGGLLEPPFPDCTRINDYVGHAVRS